MVLLENIRQAFFAVCIFSTCIFVFIFLTSGVPKVRHERSYAFLNSLPSETPSAQLRGGRFRGERVKAVQTTPAHAIRVEHYSELDQDSVPESIQKHFKAHLRRIPAETYLHAHNSTFTLRAETITRDPPARYHRLTRKDMCAGEDGPFILAAVPSVANDVSAREALRSTWASPAYGSAWPGLDRPRLPSVKVVFFFGRSPNGTEETVLESESETYGDIVQADFVDSYRNLTLKTLTILHWTRTYCPRARHLLKVDTDTFVNLPALVDLLAVLSGVQNYVLGYIYASGPPPVRRTGRWGVSQDVYAPDRYPYYPVGPSYIVSGDAVQKLLDASRHVPLVELEDVYVTGILAKTCQITRINCPLFASRFRNSSKCVIPEGWAISETPCDTQKMYSIWRLIVSGECMRDSTYYGFKTALRDRYPQTGERFEW